ncbi:MAG TPA: T9SS type A sorting domain-containing protein, partial [Saprospiraceae bacterium]|nr:T9SS type A sorting domain-containing protein [Saprospiraceae bacterium]
NMPIFNRLFLAFYGLLFAGFEVYAQPCQYIANEVEEVSTIQKILVVDDVIYLLSQKTSSDSVILYKFTPSNCNVMARKSWHYEDFDENYEVVSMSELALLDNGEILMFGYITRFFPNTLERRRYAAVIHLDSSLNVINIAEKEAYRWDVQVDTTFGYEVTSRTLVNPMGKHLSGNVFSGFYLNGGNNSDWFEKHFINRLDYDITSKQIIEVDSVEVDAEKSVYTHTPQIIDGNLFFRYDEVLDSTDILESCDRPYLSAFLAEYSNELEELNTSLIHDPYRTHYSRNYPRKGYEEQYVLFGAIDTLLCGAGGQHDYIIRRLDSNRNTVEIIYQGTYRQWNEYTDMYYDDSEGEEAYYFCGYGFHVLGDSTGLVQPILTKMDAKSGEILFMKAIDFPNFKPLHIQATGDGFVIGGNYFPSGGFGIFRQAAMVLIDREGNVQLKTGNEDIQEKGYFRLYPNPTTGDIQLRADVDQMGELKIMVCNAQGQLVIEEILNDNVSTIHLGQKGIFFYQLMTTADSKMLDQGKIVVE